MAIYLDKLKVFFRHRLPFIVRYWRKIRTKVVLMNKMPGQVFSEIHQGNKWGDQETLSGPGSRLNRTESIRHALPQILTRLNCTSMLDIPCGDFHWMKTVALGIDYIGADIVTELVQENQKKYGNENKQFITLDIITDQLPKVDLILCRDCFVHLSTSQVKLAIKNIKLSGSRYLLTTTFTDRDRNSNIVTGEWRAVNLQKPPFSFPIPLELIDDTAPSPNYYDKYLGLWMIEDIP